jgi:hypothetical protein
MIRPAWNARPTSSPARLRELCPDAELAHERIGPGWTA